MFGFVAMYYLLCILFYISFIFRFKTFQEQSFSTLCFWSEGHTYGWSCKSTIPRNWKQTGINEQTLKGWKEMKTLMYTLMWHIWYLAGGTMDTAGTVRDGNPTYDHAYLDGASNSFTLEKLWNHPCLPWTNPLLL